MTSHNDQLPATLKPTALTTTIDADLHLVPALIADAGEPAAWRYIEFFTANIRNPNTRRAYARACSRFFAWCEHQGLTLTMIRPFDVATYIEALQQTRSPPGVKQQLAAVRMLFDWLITGQVVPVNPASAVRGPKHVVKTGKTPVLDAADWRTLFNTIPTDAVRDLRDRALIATLTYSFARINAALKMKVEDLRPQGAGWRLRLHEKGGKHHTMPCHHALAEALHAYIAVAGIGEDRKGWLFRTSRGHNATVLSELPMDQSDAWHMIRRRAVAAGIHAPIGNHTFRATGITAYLANGGALEHAQEMAAAQPAPRCHAVRRSIPAMMGFLSSLFKNILYHTYDANTSKSASPRHEPTGAASRDRDYRKDARGQRRNDPPGVHNLKGAAKHFVLTLKSWND
jgi:site-specific recombinase XerD